MCWCFFASIFTRTFVKRWRCCCSFMSWGPEDVKKNLTPKPSRPWSSTEHFLLDSQEDQKLTHTHTHTHNTHTHTQSCPTSWSGHGVSADASQCHPVLEVQMCQAAAGTMKYYTLHYYTHTHIYTYDFIISFIFKKSQTIFLTKLQQGPVLKFP